MSATLFLFVFIAVVVIPFLSFLRNGAILRGGAVPGGQRTGKGRESSSIIALCGRKASRSPAKRNRAASTLEEAARNAAISCDKTRALGSPTSPFRQSREVLPQARRKGDEQKGPEQLQQVSGRPGGVVEAMSASSPSFDVTSVWDRKQLSADDNIRLVFLFTLAVPIFTFWYCNLRTMEQKLLLQIYRHCRSPNETVTIDECPQTFFRLSLAALLLGFGSAVLVWYAHFVYLNHREKDVSLKRHNKTWCDRAVNWFKFCVYRRYVDCQCRLWKRYFSLQLVSAYGPLPLFLFPVEAGDGGRGDAAMENAHSPMRALGLTSGTRHRPFSFPHSTASTHSFPSPLDTQVTTASASQHPASPIDPRKHGQVSSLGAVLGDVSANNLHKSDVDTDRNGRDEEKRKLVRARYSSAFTQSAMLSPKKLFDAHRASNHLHVRQTSVAPPLRQLWDCSPPPQQLQLPAMRRAHYFFAAHPHGILPWCCCVNMLSNVAHRDEKLFLDNRELVLHSLDAPPMSVSSEMMQHSSSMPSLPRTDAIFATSSTHASSPSVGLIESTPALPPTTTVGDSTGFHSAAGDASYAKGRYYVYDPALKKFILRLGKDEAVPSTSANAEVYRRSLHNMQTKGDSATLNNGVGPGRSLPHSSADTGAASAASTTSSPPRRLKIRIRAVVASFPFYLPIIREVYMLYGYMDASYDTCKRVLLYNNSTQREREGLLPVLPAASTKEEFGRDTKDGDKVDYDANDNECGGSTLPDELNHLLLFPGGASEALLSSAHGPARLLLRRRRGFLRLAIHTQSGLVPVYTFGETDYFEQCSSATAWHVTPVDDDADATSMSRRESGADTLLNPESAGGGGAAAQTMANASPLSQERQQTPWQPPQSSPTAGLNDGATASSAPTDYSGDTPLFTGATQLKTMRQPCQPLHSHPPWMSPVAPALSHPAAMPCELHRRESWKDQERRLMKTAGEARTPTPLYVQPLPLAKFHDIGNSAGPRAEVKSATPLPYAAHLTEETQGDGVSNSKRLAQQQAPERGEKAVASSFPALGSFWRFIRVVQRLFQKTFGLSLPVVKNIIPHRVTGATVVGRPIYFELPPDLQRMYTDQANDFDTEKDKEVLQAAQEVYFHELQELFLKYASQYLKDPSRRKLEII